jgi:hypothetical protein
VNTKAEIGKENNREGENSFWGRSEKTLESDQTYMVLSFDCS